jgi:hypothetical protein
VGVRDGCGRNVIVACGRGDVIVAVGVAVASIAANVPDCTASPAIANAPHTQPNTMPTVIARIICKVAR